MVSMLLSSSKILITLIHFYRYLFSPLVGPTCRFSPTCSQYGIESLNRFGTVIGSWLTLKRVLKCHCFNSGGYDPVPKNSIEKTLCQRRLMMDVQYNILVIAFLFISCLIWQEWEKDDGKKYHQNSINQENIIIDDRKIKQSFSNDHYITVKNDVLEITINTCGGDVEKALLITYPKSVNSQEPFSLLETTSKFIYQAQSGLTGHDGPDNPSNGSRPLYNTDQNLYSLSDGQNKLIIPMEYKDFRGNIFKKTFILKRGEYAINVVHSVTNTGEKSLNLCVFGQLKQSIVPPPDRDVGNDNFALYTFRGAAYSTLNKAYKKYKFDAILNNNNLNTYSKYGWIAMLQQYFTVAWIPRHDGLNNFYTKNFENKVVAIGYKSPSILINPGQTSQFTSTLWIGPAVQDKMANIAPHLDLTVDYGWLWFISQPLFKLLKFIYGFIGNWGFAIIIITFVVRGIMYPLTKAQYTSIAKMRMLQPKIESIRARFKENKQKISQEIIELYKEEKVNPLGGCLPLLIQMPIFLALYYMLIGSVELRHAPFVLWIHDLSKEDPYYILPLLMGITMFFIQKLSPTVTTDPLQNKIMTFMPVIFTTFFLWFPSGLVLYYIVSNLVTIIQQQIIYRYLKKYELHNLK